jgi:hypothetical protein
MTQWLQIIGAVLLLSAFAAAQWGGLPATSVAYLAVNTVGAADLAVLALAAQAWGFTLLEGTWAAISLTGLLRQVALAQPRGHRRPRHQPRRLAEPGTVGPTGDELAESSRLVRLFRDTYTASQGRQWVQAHVLWWIVLFLRGHGVRPAWDTVSAPHLAHTITTLPLPPGHQPVHPPDQVALNFRLWWPLLVDLIHAAYPRRGPRWRHTGGRTLPDVDQLEDRAHRLGLRPWMSSGTTEELAGIGHALAVIDQEIRCGRTDAHDFMIRILLPALLIVELRWLHTPGGRPRDGTRPTVDIMLLRQCEHARRKRAEGRSLTPLNHLYLHAGDILNHLPSVPDDSADPRLRRVVELYRELQKAGASTGTDETSAINQ